MTPRGKFITLEGGEGAGKSTQVKLLQQALTAAGTDAVATREPGGTPEAERIRDILVQSGAGKLEPLTEALLLSAARHEHIVHKIRPALEKGQWVISDRFIDSTRAMQGDGMGLDHGVIEALYYMISDGLHPDLTFIFDIDPEAGLARSSKRLAAAASTEDRYERMDLEFHKRLHQGFLAIAQDDPARCVVIDAARDVQGVHHQIIKAIEARLNISLQEARYG
jgi:dTMP kinase